MTRSKLQSLVLAMLLSLVPSGAFADAPRVSEVAGLVEIGVGDPPQWRAANAGETLEPGWAVRVGPGARAELEFGKGSVRLYENTLLRLPADALGENGPQAVELERGGSLFDINKKSNADGFEVRTPEAVVTVKGTRFSVNLDGSAAAVAVFRGMVGVRNLVETLENEVLVRQGFTAIGGMERAFELHFDRAPDPWKSWNREKSIKIPSSDAHAAPEKAARAVTEARLAAQRQIRPKVVSDALKQDPQLRENAKKRIKELRAQQPPANMDPSALQEAQLKAQVMQEVYADLRKNRLEKLQLDPAVRSPDPAANLQIQSQLTEELLNSGDTSGAPGWMPLDITFITGATVFLPDVVAFYDPVGNTVAAMTEAQVTGFLATGNTTVIPPEVMTNLIAGAIDPVQFFMMVHQVYF